MTFRCSRDGNATVHRYPRKPDPYYTGTEVTAVGVGTTTFECNIGVSTVPTFYVGLGSVQSAIIAPRLNNNSGSKFDVAANGSATYVLLIVRHLKLKLEYQLEIMNMLEVELLKDIMVVFDDPLSYSNIGLNIVIHSSGIGTAATIDMVVGQGSSIVHLLFRILVVVMVILRI